MTMSSLKRANKSVQKVHQERGQLVGRKGLLEKKKDYKLRARDFQKKRNAIRALEKKALERNPDEFYFKMVKTIKKDGVHQERESDEPTHTDEQIKLMRSQDIKYVTYKRSTEMKKIERLKAELHLLNVGNKAKNKHIIFVESKREARKFDPVKHFNTHPAYVDRAYNRPTLDTLNNVDEEALAEATLEGISEVQAKKYKELERRIKRERELKLIADKMSVHKHLLNKKNKKTKLSEETKTTPAQYKWAPVRKR